MLDLSREGVCVTGGAGFLGKSWDSFVPGPSVWKEMLRVCRPGAILLAYCGTRTADIMSIAIRLGGWKKIDEIDVYGSIDWLSWVYSCLSGDTEILTSTGWKKGTELQKTDEVAQWNKDDNQITFVIPEDHIIKHYKGEMIKFTNSDTDQLVTPNHRVYHRERQRKMVDGIRTTSYSGFIAKEARDINRWNPIKIPTGGMGIHETSAADLENSFWGLSVVIPPSCFFKEADVNLWI